MKIFLSLLLSFLISKGFAQTGQFEILIDSMSNNQLIATSTTPTKLISQHPVIDSLVQIGKTAIINEYIYHLKVLNFKHHENDSEEYDSLVELKADFL